jgi:hypothetical protein
VGPKAVVSVWRHCLGTQLDFAAHGCLLRRPYGVESLGGSLLAELVAWPSCRRSSMCEDQEVNPRPMVTARRLRHSILFDQMSSSVASYQTSSYPGASRNRQPGPSPKYFTISEHLSFKW